MGGDADARRNQRLQPGDRDGWVLPVVPGRQDRDGGELSAWSRDADRPGAPGKGAGLPVGGAIPADGPHEAAAPEAGVGEDRSRRGSDRAERGEGRGRSGGRGGNHERAGRRGDAGERAGL